MSSMEDAYSPPKSSGKKEGRGSVGRARRMSAAIKMSFNPDRPAGVDALGLGAPPPPPSDGAAPRGAAVSVVMRSDSSAGSLGQAFDAADLFTVEVEDAAGDLNEMVRTQRSHAPSARARDTRCVLFSHILLHCILCVCRWRGRASRR